MTRTFGRHLRVRRTGYYHHGIDIGDGYVVHYTGLSKDKSSATIRFDTYETFRNGGFVEVKRYSRAHSPEVVVARARSRVGENGYDVFGSNCEHFARWCMTGESRSEQVERLNGGATGLGAGTATAAGAAAGAVAIGEATGAAGAAALMKGTKTVGRLLGGGVQEGLFVLAVAPAVVANVAVHRALPDDPMLPGEERAARQAARNTTAAASALGTVGSIGVVAAAGVPGLSAVGISTGLAELGSLVGGGMVAGAGIALLGPALLALALGWIVYKYREPQTAVVPLR